MRVLQKICSRSSCWCLSPVVTMEMFSSVAGCLDSNWIVGATLEKKLLPLPLSLLLCTFLNNRKNKFRCGFALSLG